MTLPSPTLLPSPGLLPGVLSGGPVRGVVVERLTALLDHRRTGDAESDSILAALIGGIADAMERLGLIAYGSGGVGGERFLRDPSVAPLWALAHAALYTGARLPGRAVGEDDGAYLARARTAAVFPFGIRRGTHQAVRRALEPYLTPGASIYISDTYGGPYDLYVRTLPAETPDPVKARAVLEGGFVSGGEPSAIRAEQVLTYVATAGVAWLEATRTWAGVADDVTWANVELGDVT